MITMRQASVLVADECTYSLTGKVNIFGVYTTDIQINVDPTHVLQLIFMFTIEAPPEDPYERLILDVTLPGGDRRVLDLSPAATFPKSLSDERRWSIKYPLLFLNPILRPGAIEAKVIHERGEIVTAAPFISLRPPSLMPSP